MDEDEWDEDYGEMDLVGAVVLAFVVGATIVGITAGTIIWGAASLASQAVQTLRRKL